MVKGSDVGKLEEFHKRKRLSLWKCVIMKFDKMVLGGVFKDKKKRKGLILSDTTFFPLWLVYFFLCHFAGLLSHILAKNQSEGKRESE